MNIDEAEGRTLFGGDPLAYDRTRPAYPDWVFETLHNRGVLEQGRATLDVGAGNGLASRPLIDLGAAPLTLLEPDTRFRDLLVPLQDASGEACRCLFEPFEAAMFTDPFDLVVIATVFHWLDPAVRINKLAEIVNQGGTVALVWNIFQNMSLPDPFHEATKMLLAELSASPSGAPDALPFGLDRAAREVEFCHSGQFVLAHYEERYWSLTLAPREVRELYGGFSSIARLAVTERERVLDQLALISEQEFGGVVTRNMTTPLYLFTRT